MVVEGGFATGRVSPEIRSQMTTIRLMVRNGDEEEEEDAMPVDGDGDVAEFQNALRIEFNWECARVGPCIVGYYKAI